MDYQSLAILLTLLGLVLMVVEYFLPTGGFLIVGGVMLCIGAVVVVATNAEDIRETVAAVIVVCIGVPIIGIVGMNQLGKRLALKAEELETSVTVVPDTESSLVGRVGQAATPLRPAGSVVFDGKRVDAISEGVFIDAGAWVKCIEATGLTIVVRQLPKPPNLEDVTL